MARKKTEKGGGGWPLVPVGDAVATAGAGYRWPPAVAPGPPRLLAVIFTI
jgi:hypothetical protein